MLKCRFMEQLASTILKSTHGARSSKNIGRVFFFLFQPVVDINFRGIRSTYITRKCDILPFVLLLFMMRFFYIDESTYLYVYTVISISLI